MQHKPYKLIYLLILLILIGVGFYFISIKQPTQIVTSPTPVAGVSYKNTQYGFLFSLPDSWKGYSIVETNWKGDSIDSQG